MIRPIFQPIGSSSHKLAEKAGILLGEKATHTGTLDPLAEGVLIVLSGPDRFKKEEFNKTADKTYVFSFVIGIGSDSHDLLGLPNYSKSHALQLLSEQNIVDMLHETLDFFIGRQEQRTPVFSAKRHNGASYFDHAKTKQTMPEHFEKIQIKKLRLIELKEKKPSDFHQEIIEKISKVKGNFRQKSILPAWKNLFSSSAMKQTSVLYEVQIYAVTSRRTYIRGLVRDIGDKLGLPCITSEIRRVKNGKYGVKDCICLM